MVLKYESLNDTIGSIYSSIFEPSNWNQAATNFSDMFDGVSGSILFINDEDLSKSFGVSSGFGLGDFLYYLDNFYDADPMQKFIKSKNHQHVISSLQITPMTKMRKIEFFEFMQKYGFVDCMGASFCNRAGFYGFMSVERDKAFTDAEMRKFELLKPHVTQASILSSRAAHASLLGAAPKNEPEAVAIIDAECRLLYSSSYFSKYIEKGYFELHENRLYPNRDKEEFKRIINNYKKYEVTETKKIGRSISFFLNKLEQIYIDIQLINTARMSLGPFTPAWAVLLTIKTQIIDVSAIDFVRTRYKLTPMETVVLTKVCDASSVSDMADNLEVSKEAIRYHLKNLYGKTGVSRQIELLKLVFSLSK